MDNGSPGNGLPPAESGAGASRKEILIGYVRKYIITVVAIVAVFVVVAGALIYAYSNLNSGSGETPKPTGTRGPSETPKSGTFPPDSTEGPGKISSPSKTNALVIGVDESGTVADAFVILSYDGGANRLNVLSVPRDFYVKVNANDIRALSVRNKSFPGDGAVRLGDLHMYGGAADGHSYVRKYLNEMLSIDIDFYFRLDLESFRSIIDNVGGVWMDVRPGGFLYETPERGVEIDIPGGRQKLDGKMAEGIVRYVEDYGNGDLGRIAMQQAFLKELFAQILTKENIMSDPAFYFNYFKDNVKTDFKADDLLKLIGGIRELSAERMEFRVLPGGYSEVESLTGTDTYFRHNPSATLALMKELFTNPGEEPPDVNLKELRIQVLNGGDVTGKAKAVSDALEADGYNVANYGNYHKAKKLETRIVLKYLMNADELKKYFKNAVAEVDADTAGQYDIVIIIGLEER